MPQLSDLKGLEDLVFELEFFGYCALAIIAWEALSYVRRKWPDWAEQRNHERDPFVFADESRGYVLTEEVVSEETKSLQQTLMGLVGHGALLAASIAIGIYLGFDWGSVFFYAAPLFAGMSWLWQRVHSAPSRDIHEEWSEEDGAPRRGSLLG